MHFSLQQRLYTILAALLLCSLSLPLVPPSAAQAAGNGLFANAASYPSGSAPRTTAVGDFNGDGLTDIAAVNEPGHVSLLINTGRDTFHLASWENVNGQPTSLTTADLNGDGKLDLVTGDSNGSSVSVLLGEGTGDFLNNGRFTTGGSVNFVATADLNRDGKVDLITANNGSVSILPGNGNGTFLNYANYATGIAATALVIGDFNRDGKADLAVTSTGGMVSVLLGNGDGAFQPRVDYPTGVNPTAIITGDFNNDGNPDLTVANSGGSSASVLLGNGDGTFQSRIDIDVGGAPSALALGDFNRDGRLDLAVAVTNSGSVRVLLNPGDGVFQVQGDYPMGSAPSSLSVADFNLDSRPDLAAANPSAGTVSVLINAGADCGLGTFASPIEFDAFSTLSPDITTGDFNDDGRMDLVTANDGGLTVLLYEPEGNMDSLLLEFAYGSYVNSVRTGDFNRDGRLDIVAVNTGGTVAVWLGAGHAIFQPRRDIAINGSLTSVTVNDFNQDGKLDLAVTIRPTDQVGVLLGNGDGTFQPVVLYSTNLSPSSINSADLNRDGKVDLVVGNEDSRSVSVLLGNGNGGFLARTEVATGSGTESVAIADFNQDGVLDLVTGNSLTISVLLGSGNGTFQPKVDYPVDAYASTVTVGDFNGDGKVDVAAAIFFKYMIRVMLNDGMGGFLPPRDYTTGGRPYALAAGDYNQDGRLDLAVTGEDSFVSLHMNTLDSASILSIHSVDSGPWESAATWQCRVPTAKDMVTIDSDHTVTLNGYGSVQDLTIYGGLTVNGISELSVANSFDNQGIFNAGDGTVDFTGSGSQWISGGTSFHDVIVDRDSILNTYDNVTVTGMLVNYGWINETKPISGNGEVTYGLGGVKLEISNPGTLTQLTVKRRDTDYPNGPLWRQTGRYWSLVPNTGAAGFTTALTLFTSFTPTAAERACRYTGSGWDCAVTSITPNSITREGVTQFSDWTMLRFTTTSLTLSAGPASTNYGQSVTFTAALDRSAPGGMVAFYDGSVLLGSTALDENGKAALTTSALSAGTHQILAQYSGEEMYLPSSTLLAGGYTVNPMVLTITPADAARRYGEDNPFFNYAVAGFIAGESASNLNGSPAITTIANSASPVGSYAITAARGSLSAPNYTFAFQDGTLTVNPAVLEVQAEAKTRKYGDANPPLTYAFRGFVNGEGAEKINGAPSLATTADLASPVGGYLISASKGTLSAANYTFAFTGSTLTITPALLTVKADDLTWSPGAHFPTLTYTVTGFVNGEDIRVISGWPELSTTANASGSAGQYPITISVGSMDTQNYMFRFVDGIFKIKRLMVYLPFLLK